jgi:hypothetical protein
MGQDPHVPNYDQRYRVIRSFFNGSRGPLLRQATALDWAGDPIDVAGRFDTLHGETTYQEMLDHFRDYTDVVGDNHVNLGATTLGLAAYALTGEAQYRNWTLEYVDAWVERTQANGGVIPSSVGPDGRVESGYGWYGGVYGWGFTVMEIPWRGKVAHRAVHLRTPFAFANALLLTGRQAYVDLWREVIDQVNAHAKLESGRTVYPHMYGRLDRLARLQRGESLDDLPADGPTDWYEFRPQKFAPSAEALWFWTLDRSALELLDETPRWVRFLDGHEPDYPEIALRAELERLRSKVADIRADRRAPDRTMSDDMNHLNPGTTTDRLIQLMLGGIPTGRDVHALHAMVRYFDPVRRRAGLPEDVGALVERMSDGEVTLQLVNLDPLVEHVVVVQSGAYAEHQITSVRAPAAEQVVDHSHITVRLAPGAGARLTLTVKRYVNQPTFAFPWI